MAAEGGTYTISQAAERLGVTAYTLRYYDKEGLLPFVGRSQGGARVFTDQDLENLRIISCLKASGMPIKDIREFLHWCALGDESLSQRYQMFLERKAAVEAQMEQLRRTMEVIKDVYKRQVKAERRGGGVYRGAPLERRAAAQAQIRRRPAGL